METTKVCSRWNSKDLIFDLINTLKYSYQRNNLGGEFLLNVGPNGEIRYGILGVAVHTFISRYGNNQVIAELADSSVCRSQFSSPKRELSESERLMLGVKFLPECVREAFGFVDNKGSFLEPALIRILFPFTPVYKDPSLYLISKHSIRVPGVNVSKLIEANPIGLFNG